ncbi:MAG TPA: sensor domain-containing diguanylate cyclase [Peptococcaceae bacterium]|jgi:diguanylate cyclase (GGDEF)-like protein|nr:sensor domain-containing diguanylate cyclase [Peptococcaceae bacterium]HPZ71021.1 sensor domain-containing diguanylate cyclase [Peptococcaceae bacterium]HQD54328.1 sensor domain-containing diguanylate cyclase [Peptococcaceae bacterium]
MPEKKEKFSNILIRYQLFFCLLAAALAVAVATVATYRQYKSAYMNILAEIRDQQTKLMEEWFNERVEEIAQLSQSVAVKENNFEQVKNLFAECLSHTSTCFEDLAFADRKGNVLVAGALEQPEVNIADREYYNLALEGESNVSEILISKLNGKFTLVVSSPVVSEEGEISGLVIGTVNIEKLEQMLSFWNIGQTGSLYLLDRNGIMITDPYTTLWPVAHGTVDKTGKYRFQLDSGAIRELKLGESGYGDYDSFQGNRVLGAYRQMDNFAWSIAVEVDKAEVVQPFRQKLLLSLLVIAGIFALMLYPLLKFYSRKLMLPFEQTTAQIAQYAENAEQEGVVYQKAEGSPGYQYQEIAVLNRALQKLSEKMNELNNMMRVQALYDPLTGLANRRHFFARGQEIIELVRRKGSYCSLIYFDIDGFKKINDRYGNNIGDQVLIYIAEVLGRIARISDVAGRLGGEEFAVILPETDEKGAMQFASRFKKYVEEIPVEAEYQSFYITISIGVATVKPDGKERESSTKMMEELINQSEKAMLKAKEKGGNRVELFSV